MSAKCHKRAYSARLNVEYGLVRDCRGAGRLGTEATDQVTFDWDQPMRAAQVRAGGMAAIEPRMTGSKNRFSCDFSAKAPGVITCLRRIF
jgi:hypothetical protein